MTGIISNIQRFSLHDGPGVRTTVFFKGCPLRCVWCHNPETYAFGQELRYKRADCVFCGSCVKACPVGALSVADGRIAYDIGLCTSKPTPRERHGDSQGAKSLGQGCGGGGPTAASFPCVRECPTGALAVTGQAMTVGEVVEEILSDAAMYERTGGGVTLSGGEASAQYEFAKSLIEALKVEGIHVALDTCGQCAPDRLMTLAGLCDLVLFDLKHADPQKHREQTGIDNRLILQNLCELGEVGTPVEARIPVIPGLNDDDEDISAMAKILADNLHVERAVLLGYHPLGRAKIYDFDRQGGVLGVKPPSRARLHELAERMQKEAGIPVTYR